MPGSRTIAPRLLPMKKDTPSRFQWLIPVALLLVYVMYNEFVNVHLNASKFRELAVAPSGAKILSVADDDGLLHRGEPVAHFAIL